MEFVQLHNYQNVLHFQHCHIMLSNEHLLIYTNQDLLSMAHPYPLFYIFPLLCRFLDITNKFDTFVFQNLCLHLLLLLTSLLMYFLIY